MTKGVNVNVEHVTRIEGHGSITLSASDHSVKDVRWTVTEAPRLFEAFVRGRPWDKVAMITSRICGICSIGHAMASLKATEAAMGIDISEQTGLFRRLAVHAENMQSHILHVGYLTAPDIFGEGSVVPLVGSHPETVERIIRLHRLGNDMSDLICGRTTHPVNLVPGGMWEVTSEGRLLALRERLSEAVDDFEAIAELLVLNAGKLPYFKRETEFIALTSQDEYALYDGEIGSTDTGTHELSAYTSIVNEFVVPHSTAKFTRHKRDSYMVGALARLNLNSRQLSPGAKRWMDEFGLKPVCHNPFMNNLAQMVEFIHSLEESMRIIDRLVEDGVRDEGRPSIRPRAGHGIGAVEVPRGMLIHDYLYDDKGRCARANCVIPTNQNHNNIQKDMEAFAPTLLGKSPDEVELSLEMLVRAYDPCVSCSTHYLDVRWQKGGERD